MHLFNPFHVVRVSSHSVRCVYYCGPNTSTRRSGMVPILRKPLSGKWGRFSNLGITLKTYVQTLNTIPEHSRSSTPTVSILWIWHTVAALKPVAMGPESNNSCDDGYFLRQHLIPRPHALFPYSSPHNSSVYSQSSPSTSTICASKG